MQRSDNTTLSSRGLRLLHARMRGSSAVSAYPPRLSVNADMLTHPGSANSRQSAAQQKPGLLDYLVGDQQYGPGDG